MLLYSRDVKLFHLVELRLCTHWTMAFYCPLPSAPGEHHSVTCFCEADYFGYFTLSGIMEYLCFGNWLISVRIISSEFAHVIVYNRIFHKGNWSMRCCWICLCVGKRGSEASSSAILLRSLLSDYFFFLYNLIVGFSLLVVPSWWCHVSPSWRGIFCFVDVKSSVWWYFEIVWISLLSNLSFTGADICWLSLLELIYYVRALPWTECSCGL